MENVISLQLITVHNNDMRVRIYVCTLPDRGNIRHQIYIYEENLNASATRMKPIVDTEIAKYRTLRLRYTYVTLRTLYTHFYTIIIARNTKRLEKYDSTIHRDTSRDRLTRILTESNMASLELSNSYRCLCTKWPKSVNIKQCISPSIAIASYLIDECALRGPLPPNSDYTDYHIILILWIIDFVRFLYLIRNAYTYFWHLWEKDRQAQISIRKSAIYIKRTEVYHILT